ncbi:hypothetical protein [Marispirochaeta sp.]|uniref:hypothetical protein n=1 Tax=Marispirochaeta sp. TaxID=2038653 RepID=UPI0029C628E4|nr:hypothetical protein [Marispirochaeta sp.]
MRTGKINAGIVILFLMAFSVPSQANSGPELYGYLENGADSTRFSDDNSADAWHPGAYVKLRLKGDWQPEERLRFHLEADWQSSYGTAHQDFSARRLGLDGLPGWEAADAAELLIDHAWGLIDMGSFDIQAGKIPLAWGTGYVFNPSARVNPSDSLNPGGDDETPGITGITSSVYLDSVLTISAYLAAEDRGRNADPDRIAHDAANIPWGTRIRGFAGPFDMSLGVLREVVYDSRNNGFDRPLWLTCDGVGNLAGINLYWEGALRISDPSGDAADSDWTGEDALELIAGFHAVPAVLRGVEVRGEYFYHGAGSTHEDEYDVLPVLSGTQEVMGRHYLFGYLEKRFFDYHLLSCGTLVNAVDLSGAVFSEYAWELTANTEFSLGSVFYYGTGEFQGVIDTSDIGTGTGTVDSIGNQVYAKLRLSF